MKKIKNKARPWPAVVFFGMGVLSGLMMLFAIARLTWHTKFYPGIKIAQIEVGGLSREQAKNKIMDHFNKYVLEVNYNGAKWVIPAEYVAIELDRSLNEAYRYGRRFMLGDYLLLLINKNTNFPLLLAEGKTPKLEQVLAEIASAVEIPPIDPSIQMKGKTAKIINGDDGVVVDNQVLDLEIRKAFAKLSPNSVLIPIQSVVRQLSEEELTVLQKRADSLLNRSLTLGVDDDKIILSGEALLSLLATNEIEMITNKEKVREYVEGVGERINKQSQDAKFEFSEGKVQEFAPGKDGVEVNKTITTDSIQQAVEKLLNSDEKNVNLEITVNRTPPKVTTEKVNELGINQRIGRGESYYAHSIPNRVYNVGLAAERANSALIAPGEEFSFNKVVGEISGATGYRTAYVISGGRTVLGDGGGVCQVSTTIFRSAMNAGLPIVERWAHAYRVGYYEQNSKPGIDATVYSPSKDLRFLNDTPGHILVQTINDPKNLHLIVEIYGTSDGRVATVTEPKVWGVSPPPPDIFQDDPSLPAGTTKQVDWSAWGAKASFEYKVVRNGETLQEKTFTSNYRPWANVYLKGTGI